MRYNTQEKKLALPEYGRNIQNMVDHCVGIEDPEERKKMCLHSHRYNGEYVPSFARCQ